MPARGPVDDQTTAPIDRTSHARVLGSCPLSALTAGRIAAVPGAAVVSVDGEVHAFADRCPHSGADLTEATVDAEAVTCPLHGARFRLADGRPRCGPVRAPLAVYRVDVQDGTAVVYDEPPPAGRFTRLVRRLRAGR